VYAPQKIDSDHEFMTAVEIQKAAHEFVRSGKMAEIDVQHDNKVVKGCCVVESFIARDDDKDFIPGAWVVGVHVPDTTLWAKIKKGELNGFSMEAFVIREDREVEIDVPPIVSGITSKSEEHTHKFYVSYDQDGKFKGGTTDVVNGHSHPIMAGTHTQEVQGHSHRFSSVDNLQVRVG